MRWCVKQKGPATCGTFGLCDYAKDCEYCRELVCPQIEDLSASGCTFQLMCDVVRIDEPQRSSLSEESKIKTSKIPCTLAKGRFDCKE